MKVDVVMPQMGESIAEGTISKWLKKKGDPIERDESLLEITTDKIDSEIPAPQSGVLAEILHAEGDTVEVGQVIARIETESEKVSAKKDSAEKDSAEKKEKESRAGKKAAPAEKKKTAPVREEESEEKEAAEEEPPEKMREAEAAGEEQDEEEKQEEEEEEEEKLHLSPVVRNIAEKENLSQRELSAIKATGRGGRLTREDVLNFLEERKGKPAAAKPKAREAAIEIPRMTFKYEEDRVEIIPMNNMRKRIAEHMVYSKHVSPHVYTVAEVDMSKIVRYRERVKADFEENEGFKLTFTPFVLHATVQALKSFPLVNSSVEGDQIIRKEYFHLGIAVAIEEGLIVPVIKEADEKNLLGLARAAHELAERARARKLRPEDVEGGTFTVTNPGVFGNIFGLPIINQPQIGILGVGAIKKRAVVIDDAIAIRSLMFLSLSYDHRVIDGALAGRFLQEIRSNLEEYDLDRAL